MILRTRGGHNREVRDLFDGADRIPRPSEFGGVLSKAGQRVDFGKALGLPAVFAAHALLTETTLQLPLKVYDRRREVEFDLFEAPNPEQDGASLWAYMVACRQRGGGYLQKAKKGGRVVGLWPIEPSRVTPCVEGSELVFHVRTENRETRRLTRREVIYVPGKLLEHPWIGVSPIAAERHALGIQLGRQEYEARFYASDGTPGVVIRLPEGARATAAERKEMVEGYDARHAGAPNAHRTGIVWGGASIERLAVNMADAEFIAAQNYGVRDIARIYGIPSKLLADPEAVNEDDEKVDIRYLKYGLGPNLAAIENALRADPDLFAGRPLRPKFHANAIVRTDLKSRNESYLKGRQAGWLSVNDIRRMEDMEEIEGGDTYQETPVGGAPNLQPS